MNLRRPRSWPIITPWGGLYVAAVFAVVVQVLSIAKGGRAELRRERNLLQEDLAVMEQSKRGTIVVDSLRQLVTARERRAFIAQDDFAADDQVSQTVRKLAGMASVELDQLLTKPAEHLNPQVRTISVDLTGSGMFEALLRFMSLIHGAADVEVTGLQIRNSLSNPEAQLSAHSSGAGNLTFRITLTAFSITPAHAF
jgi:hypothetical protein